MNEYIAVIQAGGKGTRMRELTRDEIPKPMLMLNGKPMLQWQLENVAAFGIRDFVIITGHLGEKISEYFGDGTAFGLHIQYVKEEAPLGSAGSLFYLKEAIGKKDFIFIYGDVMFELDWSRMTSFHEKHGGIATLLAHPNAHPFDSDLLIINKDDMVTGIDPKNHERTYWYENCVNAGIFILGNRLLEQIRRPEKLDLEKDVLLPLMEKGEVFGYCTPEYVKDAGTPERFQNACAEQANGTWYKKCLVHRQKCIFLDRDGTLNQYRGLISCEENFELEETAAEAIRCINASGYLAIVITNQPVVARGMCSIEDVENIHRKLQTLLGEAGAYLDDIVFCPHHPDKGYPEENPAYKIKCECRKPNTGMIDAMAEKYNIDLSESWMIGDSTMDIQTGVNAGMHTALVRTGVAGTDGKYDAKADMTADHVLSAVQQIVQGYK